ncbi:MAG: lamin tail domain-containing protein [Acidimicrobiia bacterium]|nr:lamin tail domain-containing protein [Acidimicrobiia bacterium]
MTRVLDGDTIVVATGEGEIDVRLAGINAPEGDECSGDEATDELKGAVEDRAVRLEVLGTDQFERTLAFVSESGRNINLEMVRLGLAIVTTPSSAEFLEAERDAATAKLGLWAPGSCSSGPLPQIVISDATVDPPGRDEENLGAETVTLHNPSGVKVNIGGWVLRDESSRHRFTFQGGSILDAGASITVTSADRGWDPGDSPVWNNDGDIVMLLDRHGRVVDHWRYPEPEADARGALTWLG